jgi:quinol monooxygenase YgiN
MIKVIAKITIKPDLTDTLKNIVPGLVAETRKESGCISYQLFQDINQKNVFAFIEEWENEESLEKHMNSKHFQEGIPKIAAIQEKEMEVNICTLVI